MYCATPAGITPPSPGLDREEPELVLVEEDIPLDDNEDRESPDIERE